MLFEETFRDSWALLLFLCIANAPVVASQDSGSVTELVGLLPNCSLPCLLNGIQAAACDLTALPECLCPNIPLQANVSACVQLSCDYKDQATVSILSNKLCAEYPKESRHHQLLATAIACAAVVFPIVILRCISRLKVTSRLWLDDWMTLVATVILAALIGVVVTTTKLGLGLHYWNVDVRNAVPILKLMYASEILYIIIQVAAKGSLLAFYARIFPNRNFQIAVWVGVAFLVGHGILFLGLVVFECRPVAAIWDRSLERQCLDLTKIALAGASLAIFEDIAFLVMPIPELLKLQLSTKKRIALLLVFSVGSFACITSMVRLKTVLIFGKSLDQTWDYVDGIIWSVVELTCALACAGLPALWPLIKSIPGVLSTVRGSKIRDVTDLSSRGPGTRPKSKTMIGSQNRMFKELPKLPTEHYDTSERGSKLEIKTKSSYMDMESSSRDEDLELQSVARERSAF
ncbi:hypothetical protein B0J13DRAFT_680477 [Dactylonectria estremocensis]|uniref:CFEM domain-containing protein n=1 Tax=Dactylonectria estremocensis TaxID=1079267 RepID=A0A9P9DJP1_9HYPO|nr:hypothetical protein B0J13DRAFT_680477 [Dactylonectria estremocensis]